MEKGAETVLKQCLNVQNDESVLILNDSNDERIINALVDKAKEITSSVELLTFPEPDNHGEEPPQNVARKMKEKDVVVAPTKKSLSHTKARVEACKNNTRVATMPGITEEIWKTSLQADYQEVKRISQKVYNLLEKTSEVKITTPSGTDLTLEINIDYFHQDTGLIHQPGDFGNLPAGEADGGSLNANGTLVIDHFPFAPQGTKVEIKENKIVGVEEPNNESSELSEALENIEGAEKVAEFGFGTNPKATLIGNVLQDEKVLGTVHIAFGDNTSYIPEQDDGHNPCEVHWDTISEEPTVYFDNELILDEGKPVFLDNH